MRVPFDELMTLFRKILVAEGMPTATAALSARLFAEASRDGVASHGLNRFPRYIEMIRNGMVDPAAEAEPLSAAGAIERWTGNRGPGNVNAKRAMERAIELAGIHGLGCVALAHTNHWMRGGAYGWQAAEAGCVGICWTNTMPNMPPWGSSNPLIGNNPFIMAVPRKEGHVVLDMAMSQFSYGAVSGYAARGDELPVPGGYDEEGNLTRDAAALDRSAHHLPIGFWKGSGMSILLDMTAALLSGGLATHQIPIDPEREGDLSQIFIAFDLKLIRGDASAAEREAEALITALKGGDESGRVRYPGEGSLKSREESMRLGVAVDEQAWQTVQDLARD